MYIYLLIFFLITNVATVSGKFRTLNVVTIKGQSSIRLINAIRYSLRLQIVSQHKKRLNVFLSVNFSFSTKKNKR